MGLLIAIVILAVLFGGKKAVQRANEDDKAMKKARMADMRAERLKKYGW